MVAAASPLPVIGVPVKSRNSIDGWDSVLSILQMPSGVPVATVALDGTENAEVLAAQILATTDKALQKKIVAYKDGLAEKVEASRKRLSLKSIPKQQPSTTRPWEVPPPKTKHSKCFDKR